MPVISGADNVEEEIGAVATGGGSVVAGNVAAKGDFIGRDILGGMTATQNFHFQNKDNEVLFGAIAQLFTLAADTNGRLDGIPDRVRLLEQPSARVRDWIIIFLLLVIVGIVGWMAGRSLGGNNAQNQTSAARYYAWDG